MLGLAIKGISTLATFAIAVVLARSLGPAGYGTYAFALTIVTLVALPIQTGLSHLIVREVARLTLPRDNRTFELLLRWAQKRVILALFTAIFLAAAAWLLLGRLDVTDPNARIGTIAVGLLLIFTIPMTALRGSAVRGLGFGNLGQLPDMVIRHGSFLGFIMLGGVLASFGLLQSNGKWLTPQTAMALHVVGSTSAFICAIVFLKRARTKASKDKFTPETGEVAESRGSQVTSSAWNGASLAFLSVAGLQLLNSSIDVLVLGWLKGDTEVGLYRVLVQVGALVAFGLMAINPVIHGRIARLYERNEMQALQKLVTQGIWLCMAVGGIPLVLLMIDGDDVISFVFGSHYANQGLPLRIVLLGQVANVAFGAVAALLNMTGHQSDTVRGMIIAVAINLVLNLVLIPKWGILGAATATAVSTAIWNGYLWHMVWKRLKIDSSVIGVGWRGLFRS